MDREKIDPTTLKLASRTFNPNSPAYNHPARRTVISDITPPSQNKPMQPPAPQQTLHSHVAAGQQVHDNDLDDFFARPEIKRVPEVTEPPKVKTKTKHLWPYTLILISDFALLAYSFLDKARYHHIYIGVLIVNCLLAIGIYAKGKVNRWLIIGYQLPLILVSIGMLTLFIYNVMNTNKIYQANYTKIKNDSANLSFQQKQDLTTYQDTTIFNRNSYKSESKVFYSLVGLQIVQSGVAGTVLLKKR